MVLYRYNFNCNYLLPNDKNPFLKYITNFNTQPTLNEYENLEGMLCPQKLDIKRSIEARPALPAAQAPPGISFAGGSRHTKKHRNHNHKNTHTRKHSRTHSTKRTRTTRRRLHNRIHNKKHNTSQKR